MTNREKYTEEILDIVCGDSKFGLHKGVLVPCSNLNCAYCDFNQNMTTSCDDIRKQWSEQEYTEPPVDWSKVEIDTPIVVADCAGVFWVRRHFAKYADGIVYAWTDGKTSWTAGDMEGWNFAKLAESEVNK